MQLRPLHPLFAAELVDVDFTAPPDEELVSMVEQAMVQYAVLAIRDAKISDEQHKDFSRAFGPLEIPSRGKGYKRPEGKRQLTPGIFYAGNLDHNGEIIPYGSDPKSLAKGAERFHTDSSFHTMPTKWSLLHGVETPPSSAGGDTLFVDTRAAWDDLPRAMKVRLEGLAGLHDFWKGRELAGLKAEITSDMRAMVPFPTVRHPLVRTMQNGRKAIYVGGHCFGVEGMDEREGLVLVEELYIHATQDKYLYRHRWRPHDLVIWDNRCTMHAATPLQSDDFRRDMRRTTINENGPETSAYEAMGLADVA